MSVSEVSEQNIPGLEKLGIWRKFLKDFLVFKRLFKDF